MNWTTKPIYQPWPSGSKPIKPTLTINEDGPLGEAGEFTIEPFIGIDLANGPDKTAYHIINKDGSLREVSQLEFLKNQAWNSLKERTNKVPTHDPYTNPNAHIYYSCDCGNILDPGTKRFAELNNAAMNAGWKIRWGYEYYEPFCPKCVKLKGIE